MIRTIRIGVWECTKINGKCSDLIWGREALTRDERKGGGYTTESGTDEDGELHGLSVLK
jgi:hypothetical protein